MERSNLIVFDDGPNADYFSCRRCSTHVALRRDFQCFFYIPWEFPLFCSGLFNTAENLRVDEAAIRHNMPIALTVARIYCRVCDETLGFKYVQVAPGIHVEVARGWQGPCLRDGMVNLFIHKLSRRRGDQVLSGDGLLSHIIHNDMVDESILADPIGSFQSLVTP